MSIQQANQKKIHLRNSFQHDHIEPVQSLFLKIPKLGIYVMKCYTFLSALDRRWRNMKINLDRINFTLTRKSVSFFDRWISKNYFFTIHSANELLDFNERNYFKIGHNINTYFYSTINTELLGTGYDTNCYDYDQDYKYANFNMRSDCQLSCYQTRLSQKCGDSNFYLSNSLMRKEFIDQNIDKFVSKNIDCLDNFKHEILDECSKHCRFDCKFKYYIFNHNVKNTESDYYSSHPQHFTMLHNNLPDLQIKYLPKTDLISIICNFGGLLGMWLGLSVLSIFDNCLIMVKDLFSKRKNETKIQIIKQVIFTNNTNIQQNFFEKKRRIKSAQILN